MSTRVGLVGVGRWGKKLLRTLDARCEVALCCNKSNLDTHGWLQSYYPHVKSTFDYEAVLRDPNIQAVVIATPIDTHAELATQALDASKHVFVEKPLATRIQDAEECVLTAAKKGLVLFVGHVFLYHSALDKLKALTKQDPIRYAKMVWTKFGTFKESLTWNLLSHEVSIALDLFETSPQEVDFVFRKGIVTDCDITAVRLGFGEGRECMIEVDRYADSNAKCVTAVTSAGQAFLWEGAHLHRLNGDRGKELLFKGEQDALNTEVDAFLSSVREGKSCERSNGDLGLKVVRVLDQLLADPHKQEFTRY